MDSVKIAAIINWSASRNLKNVQAFLKFANFYRKFILNYSKIVSFLTELTRAEKREFQYSWDANSSEQRAFEILKTIFITASILQHFDSNKETWIKTNASDYIVANVFSQIESDEILRFVTFMFKRMSSAKCNYEIYDKELLVIVKAFEKWRFECAETSIECLIKILTDHQNFKYFMTFKDLNKRQTRWTEFFSKFNFLITYRSGKQNAKTNSLTRRIEDFFTSESDERRKHNNKQLLKKKHLNRKIRKTVKLASMLLNESRKDVVELIIMLYDLSEEKLVDEKSIEELPIKEIRSENDEREVNEKPLIEEVEGEVDGQKVNEEVSNDESNAQSDIMTLIRKTYFNDFVLQQLMKVKKLKKRRVSIDVIRAKIKFELNRCEIRDDLFWVKERIYVSQNEEIYTALIKQIHESFVDDHVDRKITYSRIARWYYWSRMIHIVDRYVKVCHQCKRTKTYRNVKQNLLNSLFISNRYFQDISVDFIVSFSKCKRNERTYEHIMIVINRFSKKKKFVALNSLEMKAVIQAFLEWIWREKGYSISIVFDKDIQFISHFWKRLCKRIDINSKLFTAWHFETND